MKIVHILCGQSFTDFSDVISDVKRFMSQSCEIVK